MAAFKYQNVEYSIVLLSMCLLVNTINCVVISALIKLNILTTGIILTIRIAADSATASPTDTAAAISTASRIVEELLRETTMGLMKANLLIGT